VNEARVGKMNWRRVLACGILAGVVWTALSAVVTVVAGQAFSRAVPGNRLAAPSASLIAFLSAVNLAEGVWAMWLYAAIRPRYGGGPRAAVVVGLAWWVVSTLVDVTWGSFGFVPAGALVGPAAASLPATVLAAIAGAWRYTE